MLDFIILGIAATIPAPCVARAPVGLLVSLDGRLATNNSILLGVPLQE